VEHVVDVFARPAAGVEIPNVAFDEVERATGGRFGRLFEVVQVSGRKIIKSDDVLPEVE